jgi:hypothetical protein
MLSAHFVEKLFAAPANFPKPESYSPLNKAHPEMPGNFRNSEYCSAKFAWNARYWSFSTEFASPSSLPQ